MKKSFLIILLALFWSLNLWSQKDTSTITLLHINDLHAKINRFPQLKHVIDSIKNERKEDVFLVSSGDLFSGNPFVDQYTERGKPIIDLMNELHFDVSELGNHDFDYGQAVLEQRMKEASFPMICANIDVSGSPLTQPKPYVVLKTSKGIEIAILGLLQISDNGIPDSHPDNFKNLKFTTPEKAIQTYKKTFKSYDIKIALTHLGYKRDEALAKKNQWLDLIIGGHSHTELSPPLKAGRVSILQAGHDVKFLGVATLTMVGHRIVKIEDQLIPLKFQPKDSLTYQKVKDYSKNPEFQKEIAELPYALESAEEIGTLMAEAYKEGLNADIAFQNIGGVRLDKMNEGVFKNLDIMFLDPFNNEILTFDMTQKELLSFLRFAFTVRHKNNQLMAGLQAEFITDEEGNLTDIKLKDSQGNPLPENKIYKVAINSYMASSYDFSAKDKAQHTGLFSNDLLIEYFKKHFPIGK
ncbi:MAG: bifunctional metallophosphatase/5'-nucleotidase [Bacteroidales bacterium]|nr:bifunctional metallophosphatase/5'-nucleotidase [Bacteroidales bacterium]